MAAHDEAPAIISDHSFEPKGEWWTLCKHCGLAMPAHSRAASLVKLKIGYYSDDISDDE